MQSIRRLTMEGNENVTSVRAPIVMRLGYSDNLHLIISL